MILKIEPQAKARPRFWNGRVLTSKRTRAYERELAIIMKKAHASAPLIGPLYLMLSFSMPAPKKFVRSHPTCTPDLDNLIKAVKDAANGILWENDSQVCGITAEKAYDFENGFIGIILQVRKIDSP